MGEEDDDHRDHQEPPRGDRAPRSQRVELRGALSDQHRGGPVAVRAAGVHTRRRTAPIPQSVLHRRPADVLHRRLRADPLRHVAAPPRREAPRDLHWGVPRSGVGEPRDAKYRGLRARGHRLQRARGRLLQPRRGQVHGLAGLLWDDVPQHDAREHCLPGLAAPQRGVRGVPHRLGEGRLRRGQAEWCAADVRRAVRQLQPPHSHAGTPTEAGPGNLRDLPLAAELQRMAPARAGQVRARRDQHPHDDRARAARGRRAGGRRHPRLPRGSGRVDRVPRRPDPATHPVGALYDAGGGGHGVRQGRLGLHTGSGPGAPHDGLPRLPHPAVAPLPGRRPRPGRGARAG